MLATSANFLFTTVDLLKISKTAVDGDARLKHVEIFVIGLPVTSSSVASGVTPYQVLAQVSHLKMEQRTHKQTNTDKIAHALT